jgi:hypothetical protein
MKQYVQYGCGLSAPKEWINFDASPTLLIQKIPIIGKTIVQKSQGFCFPPNVRYGNIIKGLPVRNNTVDGLYCSHVLEHLALEDFKVVLKNSFTMLKEGGVFRCVVPDLEFAATNYVDQLKNGNTNASITFLSGEVGGTLLGTEIRPKGLKAITASLFGNVKHLWMWDKYSLAKELEIAGFVDVRQCRFNDSEDKMFWFVEDKDRFINAIAFECRKPIKNTIS